MKTYGVLSYINATWIPVWMFIILDNWYIPVAFTVVALVLCIFTRPLFRISKEQMQIIYLHPFKKNIKLKLDDIRSAHFKVKDFRHNLHISAKDKEYDVANTHIQRCTEWIYKALYERGVNITSSGVGAIEWTR